MERWAPPRGVHAPRGAAACSELFPAARRGVQSSTAQSSVPPRAVVERGARATRHAARLQRATVLDLIRCTRCSDASYSRPVRAARRRASRRAVLDGALERRTPADFRRGRASPRDGARCPSQRGRCFDTRRALEPRGDELFSAGSRRGAPGVAARGARLRNRSNNVGGTAAIPSRARAGAAGVLDRSPGHGRRAQWSGGLRLAACTRREALVYAAHRPSLARKSVVSPSPPRRRPSARCGAV